jgi:protein ImuB
MFACIYGKALSNDASLSEFAYGFSPLVEETAVDTVIIDINGCEMLFGSAYGLANEVANRAIKPKDAGGLGRKVNVALAGNPDTAVYAARFFEGVTFISPGEELNCLGELPIERLQLSSTSNVQRPKSPVRTLDIGHWTFDFREIEEILETLRVWGVRTFSDFAALPVTGVSERLGQVGVKLQQLASGKTDRHLKLKQATPRFENSIELEHPIIQLEPLSFLLARLLNQICANLYAYALATNELNLHLKLEDNTTHERKLNLPHPMRDPRVFLRLLLLEAEMHPPHAAVLAITINCEPVKPRVLQSGLFIPLAPEPEKLELTLARLVKMVGPNNVGSLELLDTHRPDAFRVKRFVLEDGKKRIVAGKNEQSAIRNSKSILGFRVFRPPLRALVQTTQGSPTEISAWGSNRSVHGKVVQVAGPWRTTGDWWRLDRWARDEWDVAIENRSVITSRRTSQALYRIYRELRDGTWFVEGVYD